MSDGIVQLQPDSSGKKVDTSEIEVGTNTVERQRINISDPTNPDGHAAVELPSSISGNEYGLVVRSFVHDVAQVLKRPLDVMARNLCLSADPTSGRLRTLTDLNGGTVTTVTTVTTCATCTTVNQLAGFDTKQTLLYATERMNWNQNIRSRIT